MARQSADRDDLMAEVVTLSPRVALVLPGHKDEIIAGQRADGRWSIFFGGDPVYHFDAADRLRRAFVGDCLFRSQGTTLARLTRQAGQQEPGAASSAETVLLRHDLSDAELTRFMHEMRTALDSLLTAVKAGAFTIRQVIPTDAQFLPELARRIEIVLSSGYALAPALKK